MARRAKRAKKRSKKIYGIIAVLIVILLICIGAGTSDINEMFNAVSDTVSTVSNSISNTWKNEEESKTETKTEIARTVEGTLQMHMIDVGQGDACLVRQGTKTLLIDCGTKAKGKNVVEYLQNLGVNKIDVLIGTHPHDDHMGGMAEVIKNFEIGIVYTPDNSEDSITSTWYIEILRAIDEKGIEWQYLKARR